MMELRSRSMRSYFARLASLTQGICAFLTISLLLMSSAEAGSEPESSKDVGFGFRIVIRSGPEVPNAWEKGHFGFLFYKDLQLGQYGSYSIAPSGKYALFQDGPTGAVILFASTTAKRRVVAKFRGSLVEQYLWHERQHDATIVFANRPPVRVALPAT
jgi:hypothetical protein